MPGRCPLCNQPLPHAINQDALQGRILKLASPALAQEKKKLEDQFRIHLKDELEKSRRNAERELNRELRNATDRARLDAKRDFDKQLQTAGSRQKRAVEQACRETESRLNKQLAQNARLASAQNEAKIAKLQNDRERERIRYEAESAKLQGKLDDLSRKLEKQSGEQHGSEAELDLYTNLKHSFPQDRIQRISKGVKGADILHEIVDGSKVVGRIVYESKNTLTWQQAFIAQAKKYQSQYETPNVVIVTRAFPPKEKGLCVVKGIPVIAAHMAVPFAAVIREGVTEIAKLRLSSNASSEKLSELYEYIVGDKFRTRFKEMEECIACLREFQQKERTWHENAWHAESTMHDRIANRHREVDAHIMMIVRGSSRMETPKLSARADSWRELDSGSRRVG